jgi:hypothetical protein
MICKESEMRNGEIIRTKKNQELTFKNFGFRRPDFGNAS